MNKVIPVLDKGFVQLVEFMGDDRTIVNSARVSFGEDDDMYIPDLSVVQEMSERDKNLINYMMREGHTSPFEHVVFTFVIKCPLFVRSQIHRHRTFSYNEISRRYTSEDIEFYLPMFFRKQAESDRQASVDDYVSNMVLTDNFYREKLGDETTIRRFLKWHTMSCLYCYEEMMRAGVAREQARMILPQNLYTRFYMTGNLHNWFHFLDLRDSEHAQWETREYAKAIKSVIKREVPVAFSAWENKNE